MYEKVGNRYTNFMIDEFQDTSWIQWDNFPLPLRITVLRVGKITLVVGDVKQAIYRWRNSTGRIFNEVHNPSPPEQFKNVPLTDNWRSRTNIISFNNTIFHASPWLLRNLLTWFPNYYRLYDELAQTDPGRSGGGYVRLKRVDATAEKHQIDIVLEELPGLIEEIQDMGYQPGEIGILVRTNGEGRKVIDSILNYASGADEERKRKYSYQVISQDSLLLAYNPSIKLILSSLRYLSDNNDTLAFASMVHHYRQLMIERQDDDRPTLISVSPETESVRGLPDGYDEFFRQIRFLPLFEIVDRIVKFFGLSEFTSGIPFITTFQDLVLELSGTEANDIPLFLEWWENEGHRKSVSSPEQPGAMQLMTIHKSKGLEFRVVIIPFLSWTFNHGKSPILWVQSDVAPFDRLGAVPVTYRQEISDTLFSKHYQEERVQAAIDKLNLLYVAFTRARESLFGFVPVGRNIRHCGREVMDALEAGVINDMEGSDTGKWDSEGKIFTLGEVPKLSVRSKQELSLEIPYNVELSSERLKLKYSSRDYLSVENRDQTDRINWGLLMHELFASAVTGDDLLPGIEEMGMKGRISRDQCEYLTKKIGECLENQLIASWFKPGIEVKRESAILTERGVIRRPDRVIIEPEGVTIIDFKFGEEKRSYHSQLNEYRKILESMGYNNVKAFIWYFESGKTEEVS
ncbi:MAG: 3'-5' exonuclease [Bacteroidales bacterium]